MRSQAEETIDATGPDIADKTLNNNIHLPPPLWQSSLLYIRPIKQELSSLIFQGRCPDNSGISRQSILRSKPLNWLLSTTISDAKPLNISEWGNVLLSFKQNWTILTALLTSSWNLKNKAGCTRIFNFCLDTPWLRI